MKERLITGNLLNELDLLNKEYAPDKAEKEAYNIVQETIENDKEAQLTKVLQQAMFFAKNAMSAEDKIRKREWYAKYYAIIEETDVEKVMSLDWGEVTQKVNSFRTRYGA